MAWCNSCSHYHAPTALDGGACPTCGGVVTDARGPDSDFKDSPSDEEQRTVGQSAPWHFWIVVAMLAAYLLWRAIVGVMWAIERF